MKPYSQSLVLKFFGLFFVSVAVFSSCKKDMLPIGDQPVVLVAGYESNGEVDIAKYWINGQEVVLSDGTSNAVASSIFAAGNNVYVAGTITSTKNTSSHAVLWKNNIEMKLSTRTTLSSAKSVFVSGRDVYVAGYDSGAVYWKNGQEVRLKTFGQSYYTYARSIYVLENNVYVAGTDGSLVNNNNAPVYKPVYWKNNIEKMLPDNLINTSPNNTRTATSIFVSGNDVYIAGLINTDSQSFAMYWKNENEFVLNNSGERAAQATGIFVADNNVYIAGWRSANLSTNTEAVYWKNGTEFILPTTINVTVGTSIYVNGNDIYVAGFIHGVPRRAQYWKNGVEVFLTDGNSIASAESIFVRN